ncbi:interleukin-8-like [Phyllobates terribilis]|uniref:interleukin-8-like n=1 Tax=Phyllobates terribilis TaxID=111132 RepID=UPI003CCACF6E
MSRTLKTELKTTVHNKGKGRPSLTMRTSMTILFLAVCLTYLVLSEGMSIRRARALRCRCLDKNTVSTPIPQRQILDFKIISKGAHCKNLEVIATVKTSKETSQEVCLDPTAEWVKRRILRELDSSKTNQDSKK